MRKRCASNISNIRTYIQKQNMHNLEYTRPIIKSGRLRLVRGVVGGTCDKPWLQPVDDHRLQKACLLDNRTLEQTQLFRHQPEYPSLVSNLWDAPLPGKEHS